MKIRVVLFLCCLILLLTGGCKKKETSQILYIDDSFKEWSLFQKDSYWVYLNEVNLTKDSSFVNMDPRSGFSPPPNEGATVYYEQIYYELTNSFIKSVKIYRDPNQSDIIFGNYYPSDFALVVLISGYTNGTWLGSAYYCSFVEKLDTLLVNTNKFTNVIHTRVSNSYYNNMQYDYYFVQNIGWVKYSVKTNTIDTTWSLVRWHVKQ